MRSVKNIRGLGCIYGRRNIVKGEIELLLLGVDFKQLCAGSDSVKFL
mgnify:CR=1 FL=1